MPGLKINFAEVESSFEALPEGRYDCVIDRVEVRESQSSEHDYLNWTFKILEDDHEGRLLWLITSLSPRALFRLKDVYLELGVIEDEDELELEWDDDVDIQPREGPQVTQPDVEGMAVTVVVENELYDGREQNRVRQVLSNGKPAKSASKKTSAKSGSKAKAGSKRNRKLR